MQNSIDKSELMKMAWDSARKTFRRVAIIAISKTVELDTTIRGYLANPKKSDLFIESHKDLVTRSIKDFFSNKLKEAWKTAKENIEAEIKREEEAKARQIEEDAKRLNKAAPKRELVAADKYSVGDKLMGFVITGIGRSFRPDVDMFSMGITPDTEYVEYAYFN